MICVFGHRAASEADRVIKRLRVAGADVFRVNTGDGESLASVTVGHSSPPHSRIACDGRQIDTRRTRAAWLHQMPPFRQAALPPLPGQAALSSRLNLWEAVSRTIPAAAWINPPWCVRDASNKHRQLVAATEAGLVVPATVVGTMPDAVRELGPQPTVAKYFGDSGHLWTSGQGKASLTVAVDLDRASDLELAETPLLHQARVDAVQEYRVVVVGRDAFAGVADKPEGTIDIRDTTGLPDYRRAALPESLRAGLTSMLGSLGLAYCSADLALDAAGRWTFLDLNATGAFWWIDDLHDRAITAAIADALLALADAPA